MTLIIGGSGQVGTALRRLLPEAVCPSHDELDLRDLGRLRRRVIALAPSAVINCAAYTAVDRAEDDEEAATAVNGTAVGELTAAAAHLGIPLVTYSTDYVFAGEGDEVCTESTRPDPRNAYGRSKLVGEQLAMEYAGALVVRTSWLLSTTHPNFVTTILGKVATGPLAVVDDQWGRPTMVDDLADATLDAVRAGMTGLLHLAGEPTTTWFGLARESCRLSGIDPQLVTACSSAELARPAHRPRHAVLGSERRPPLPDWRIGLERWLTTAGRSPHGDHPAVDQD